MTTLTQPLRWHGGKKYLAKKILQLAPDHSRYVELYGGGLAVLLAKPFEGIAEYVNDTNGDLMNFWVVLASQKRFAMFYRIVECLPLAEEMFRRSQQEIADKALASMQESDEESVFRAVSFFISVRQSRQGLGRDFCTPTSRARRGMNEQVSAWLTAVAGLPEVHRRLRRVEIRNEPAMDLIRELDSPDTLFYCDPPYLHDTRKTVGEYGHNEMTREQHCELLRSLSRIKGKFLLSGYPSETYDHFASDGGWTSVQFDLPNNASSSKTKERKKETVWANFKAEQ